MGFEVGGAKSSAMLSQLEECCSECPKRGTRDELSSAV